MQASQFFLFRPVANLGGAHFAYERIEILKPYKSVIY
jgi:hypothetical protein